MRTRVTSVLVASLLLSSLAVAQDAPSAPFIEPKVEAVLKAMEQTLTNASALAFTAAVTLDELHPSGMKIQHSGRRAMGIRRPDRIVSDVEGDMGNRSAWYDGEILAVLDKAHHTYAVLEVTSSPSDIDDALDFVAEEYDIVLPLADFIRADVYESLLAGADIGIYIGLTNVGGVACHQVALANHFIEWQLWIDAEGKPLPLKFVITYTDEPGEPQFAARFLSWNLAPELPDEAFQFTPPEDAHRIEASEMAAGIQTLKEDQP